MIKASGCLFLSTDTGRIMLQQRSGDTSHPRTWGFFGGKAEDKERPIQTLLRELEEEIGVVPDIQKIHPINEFISADKKFTYNTFIVTVFEEFIPILNDESDGFCWVKLGNWPRPLHYGAKAQLYNKDLLNKIKTVLNNSTKNGSNWLDTL